MSDLPQAAVQVDLNETGHGVITRLENAVAALPDRLQRAHANLAKTRSEKTEAEASLGQPFPRAADLSAAQTRLAEIDEQMSAKSEVPRAAAAAKDSDSQRITDADKRALDEDVLPPDEALQRLRETREQLQRTIRDKPLQPTRRRHDGDPIRPDRGGPSRGMR